MTGNNLYELLYTSTAKEGFEESELADILQFAKINNYKYQISGILIYYSHSFVQILEGDKQEVIELFQKISKDPRHHDIEVFYQGGISERSFANWSMAGKILNEDELKVLLTEIEPLDQNHLSSHILNSVPSVGKNLFLHLKQEITS